MYTILTHIDHLQHIGEFLKALVRLVFGTFLIQLAVEFGQVFIMGKGSAMRYFSGLFDDLRNSVTDEFVVGGHGDTSDLM